MYYVYRFLDEESKVLYVGRTENINERLTKQHFTQRGHLPQDCYKSTKSVEYCEINSRSEMKIYELYLINYHKPSYNVQDNTSEVFQFTLPEIQWVKYEGEKERSEQEEIKRCEKKVKNLRRIVRKYREKDKLVVNESDRLVKEVGNHMKVIDYVIQRAEVKYDQDSLVKLLLDIGYFCDVVVQGKEYKKSDYYKDNGWGTEERENILWEFIDRRENIKCQQK